MIVPYFAPQLFAMTEIKTDKQIIALKAEEKEYHAKIYGKSRLFIRVRATKDGAVKSWVYRYTKDGKTAKYFLGDYPAKHKIDN